MRTDFETAAAVLGVGKSLAYELVRAGEFPTRPAVRLDRGVMQLAADGVLLRSLPNPLPPAEQARLRDARHAGQTLDVETADTTWRIYDADLLLAEVPHHHEGDRQIQGPQTRTTPPVGACDRHR
jgi:hypothetical protein